MSGCLSSPLRDCILVFLLQTLAGVPNKLILDQSGGIKYGYLYGADSAMTQTDLGPDCKEGGKINKYKCDGVPDLVLTGKIPKPSVTVAGPNPTGGRGLPPGSASTGPGEDPGKDYPGVLKWKSSLLPGTSEQPSFLV